MNEETESESHLKEINIAVQGLCEYLNLNNIPASLAVGAMTHIIINTFVRGPLKESDFKVYLKMVMDEYKSSK